MNKFGIAFALVAMFVGIVAANKLHRKQHFDDDQFELEEEHRPFVHRGGHKHFGDDGEFIQRHPHHLRKGGRRHGVKGAGAGIIGGAGIRHEGEFDAGVHSGNRIGTHKSIEGHKGFIAGGKKEFNAGKNRHDLNDNEAHNRHSVTNKNKLIVKESDTGFNDDVGFHNHDEHSDSAHLSGSGSKFVAGKKGGRIVSNKNIDSEFDAGVHAGSDTEAGFGVAKGVGLAEV